MPDNNMLIAAGLGASTNAINMAFTADMNRRDRQFAEDMYSRQRADALADRDFANSYNSPAAQMKRLTEGGLNPNLVYGSGQAQAQSAPVRNASEGNNKGTPLSLDLNAMLAPLFAYINLQKTQAQTDNLKAQTELVNERVKLTGEQGDATRYTGLNTLAKTRALEQDIDFNRQTLSNRVAMVQDQRNQIAAQTTQLRDNNERQKLLTANTIKLGLQSILDSRMKNAKSAEEIKMIQAKMDLLGKDEQLKNYEIQLNKAGTSKSEGYIFRKISEIADAILNY